MIYFVTDKIIPNYINDTTCYKFINNKLSTGESLKYLETCYPYYILKNNDCDLQIKLITFDELHLIKRSDWLIFYLNTHYTSSNSIESIDCNKIQIVTDTPIIEGMSVYITYDPSILKNKQYNWHHVLYPHPIGLIKCKPKWPPENITCISPARYTCQDGSYPDDYKFIIDSYHNTGNEHVLFHLREKVIMRHDKGLQTRMRYPSHKTANRLYQSWSCNVPGIFSTNSAMEYVRRSEYDFISVDCIDELIQSVQRIQKDKELYYNMVRNCIEREDENSHDNIYKQWMHLLKQL